MYAVIKTGGKQYKISEGDVLNVEKIEGEQGDGDDETKVGTPLVEGAKVVGEIVAQTKGTKIAVFKMKRRKGYRKKIGHRQKLTSLKIKEIST
jgi:large subunit ribosomal protein L21